MGLNTSTEVAGRFMFEVSGGARGTVNLGKELGHSDGWIDNLILDSGLLSLMSNRNVDVSSYGRITLGTGNSTPTPAQTALDNGLVSTKRSLSKTNGYNGDDGYAWSRTQVQFGQGLAAGIWSEVGTQQEQENNPGAPCFSRALIVDSLGDQTTITILADEFLTVTYELRTWWVLTEPYQLEYDDDGTPATTTVTQTYRAASLDYAPYNGTGGIQQWNPPDSSPTYGATGIDENGAFCEIIIIFTISQGGSGITYIERTSSYNSAFPGGCKFTFSPPIPKTNEFEIKITVRAYIKRRGE